MEMTQEDRRAHKNATTCHVYKNSLKGNSVRDHCHISGKYRGAAHKTCNLKLRLNPGTIKIPVVVHNLHGYDSHLLMQAFSKVEGHVSCIPNNTEKYISFSLVQLHFNDSAQFLPASLDKLVAANESKAFQITEQYEPSQQRCELLKCKGVYPYEYMDSWEQFVNSNSHQRRLSTARFRTCTSAMRIIPMRKRSGRPSIAKHWETTIACKHPHAFLSQ